MKRFILSVIIGYCLVAALILFQPKRHPKNPQAEVPSQYQIEMKKANKNHAAIDAKAPPSSEALQKIEMRKNNAPKIVRTYHQNGVLSSEWQFDNVQNRPDAFMGMFKTFYPDGNVWFESGFKNGKQEGVARMYYPNGSLWEEANFKDGQLNGFFQMYYPSGSVWLDSSYENGILKEIPRIYNEAAERVSQNLPAQPIKNGDSEYLRAYYINKNISMEIKMKSSMLEGLAKIYYPTGELFKETNHHKNRMVGSEKMSYVSGEIWMETTYTDLGLRNVVSSFYPSGKLWFTFDSRGLKFDVIPRAFSEKAASDQRLRADQIS